MLGMVGGGPVDAAAWQYNKMKYRQESYQNRITAVSGLMKLSSNFKKKIKNTVKSEGYGINKSKATVYMVLENKQTEKIRQKKMKT